MQSSTTKTPPPGSPTICPLSANDNNKPECRALTAISLAAGPRRGAGGRRTAEFTAQVLAAKTKRPQARERRRAEPAEALAAYRAASLLAGR